MEMDLITLVVTQDLTSMFHVRVGGEGCLSKHGETDSWALSEKNKYLKYECSQMYTHLKAICLIMVLIWLSPTDRLEYGLLIYKSYYVEESPLLVVLLLWYRWMRNTADLILIFFCVSPQRSGLSWWNNRNVWTSKQRWESSCSKTSRISSGRRQRSRWNIPETWRNWLSASWQKLAAPRITSSISKEKLHNTQLCWPYIFEQSIH